jgi:hypothetical protein
MSFVAAQHPSIDASCGAQSTTGGSMTQNQNGNESICAVAREVERTEPKNKKGGQKEERRGTERSHVLFCGRTLNFLICMTPRTRESLYYVEANKKKYTVGVCGHDEVGGWSA